MNVVIHSIIYEYVFDIVKLFLVMNGVFGIPFKRKKRYYIIAFIVSSINITMSCLYCDRFTRTFCFLITSLIINIIVFQEKAKRKILVCIVAYTYMIFADTFNTTICLILFKQDLVSFLSSYIYSYLINGLGLLLVVTLVFVLKIKKKANEKWQVSNMMLLLYFSTCFPVTLSNSILLCVTDFYIINLKGSLRIKLLLLLAVVSFVCFLTSSLLAFVTESRNNFRTLSQFNKNIIEAQHNYYLLAQEKQQEIRSIRHEINNHLACIYGLYQTGSLEQMGEYIGQVIAMTNTFTNLFHTGNEIVDTILSEAQGKCEAKGINVKLEGTFPNELFIPQMDLCIVFANAISNAVEAIEKIDKKSGDSFCIYIKISSFKEDIFIDIINPVAFNVSVIGGTIKTTKQNHAMHGFGTKNMKRVVEKNNGSIEFTCEKNMFCVHINIKNT